MKLRESLEACCFTLDLKGDTKEEIIEEMVDLMVAAGKVRDRGAALQAVLERERKMSTGMQYGVAIPHGKTGSVEDLVTAFALKKEGADFASLDGKPSSIFIMTLSPTTRTGPHMEYLAEISKVLSRPLVRKRLLSAESVQQIIEILAE